MKVPTLCVEKLTKITEGLVSISSKPGENLLK